MSEEMNLYKRCKNIFKSHGVDMGGGSGGGARFDVAVSVDFISGDKTADKSFTDILEALGSGKNVFASLVLVYGEDSQVMGTYPFIAQEGCTIAFGYYYQGDIDGFALFVEHDEDTGEDYWASSILPQPETND